MQEIKKPIHRSLLRSKLGKEYYILKRKLNWYFGKEKFSKNKVFDEYSKLKYKNSVFKHKSMILRPLKDVDMYLQENKRENLRIAIEHLNQIEINPGETFSIWKLIGKPTKKKGYLEGLVLKSGTVAKDIGGGLCQLGNLLFWIFAHSPLTIKERHRHGYDVFPDVNRKVPFGAGATLSYNHIDLQVKNETNHHFKIKLWLDKTHLNGELLSIDKMENQYSIEERNHIIKQQIWGGYSRHNQIFQLIKKENKIIQEKIIVENHAIMMYTPFIENKK
ncbi:MAG: vancomycin resistance protein [Crocinitomicaceae bacterium]|nr:vancomycin resistance protein [Crocinitomicaceae bacterium]